MIISHSIGSVGAFQVLISNEGQHSARQWAWATVNQIVKADENAHPERKVMIERLRREMVEAVEPFFVHPDPLTAGAALQSIRQVSEGSEWEIAFDHPGIQADILLCIQRNLATARPN